MAQGTETALSAEVRIDAGEAGSERKGEAKRARFPHDFLPGWLLGAAVDALSDPNPLQGLCEAAVLIPGCTGAAIFLWERSGTRIAARGEGSSAWVSLLARPRQLRSVQQALRSGKAIALGPTYLEPLRLEGQVQGAFAFHSSRDERPPALPALARLAALALERERGRTRDRDERSRLRRRIALLEADRQSQDRHLSFLRHELKNPLVAMKGYTDMLLRGMAGPVSTQRVRYLEKIAEGIEKERALIDALCTSPTGPKRAVELGRWLQVSISAERCFIRGTDAELSSLQRLVHRLAGPAGAALIRTGSEVQLTLVLRGSRRADAVSCLRALACRLQGRSGFDSQTGERLVLWFPLDSEAECRARLDETPAT